MLDRDETLTYIPFMPSIMVLPGWSRSLSHAISRTKFTKVSSRRRWTDEHILEMVSAASHEHMEQFGNAALAQTLRTVWRSDMAKLPFALCTGVSSVRIAVSCKSMSRLISDTQKLCAMHRK